MRTFDLFCLLITITIATVTYMVLTNNQALDERLTYIETSISHLETNQARIIKRIEWKYGMR